MPKKAGRPKERGTPPIRGQMRWHEDDWKVIEEALAKLGVGYAEFARPTLLKEAKKVLRKPKP